MFTTLLESGAPRTRRLGGTAASLLAHGALMAGAVALTVAGPVGATAAPPTRPDTIVFVVAPPPVERVSSHRPQSSDPMQPAQHVVRAPTHVYVDIVPPTLPPVESSGPVVAPDDVIIGRSGSDLALPGGRAGAGGVIAERDVDRAPHVLGAAPVPRYPEVLRGAGITGRVVLQFVVDTLGRAEPGGVEVVTATRAEFADAVRAALPRYRFSAGEAAGRKVRTRVEIPFDFTLR